MVEILEIASGDSRARIAAGLGGSLLGWKVAGQAMLHDATHAEVASASCLGLASFPLVPYSNRIGHGSFVHAGERVSLIANFAPEPHAIHGTGWEDSWTVVEHDAHSIALELRHRGDGRWPWPFVARQEFAITDDSLTLHLSATNLAESTVPLAFGHHPYFDADGASLQFNAEGVWSSGPDMLPTGLLPVGGQFDFGAATPVTGHCIDHCYSGWHGLARIEWAGRKWALEIASDLPAAVVYIPKGGDRFCFEPVPHSNDALNRHDAAPTMPVIGPGESFSAWIELRALRSSL